MTTMVDNSAAAERPTTLLIIDADNCKTSTDRSTYVWNDIRSNNIHSKNNRLVKRCKTGDLFLFLSTTDRSTLFSWFICIDEISSLSLFRQSITTAKSITTLHNSKETVVRDWPVFFVIFLPGGRWNLSTRQHHRQKMNNWAILVYSLVNFLFLFVVVIRPKVVVVVFYLVLCTLSIDGGLDIVLT